MRVLSLLFSLFFMGLFSPLTSQAFKVSPIELNFDTKGPKSVKTILVENTTENKIPVEIFAFERTHANGKETRTKTRDFYFFPEQLILKPGEKRNIRISWMGQRSKKEPKDRKKRMKKGDLSLDYEKAYRLEIKQVPVELKKNKKSKTGISFLYNYTASLYVTPQNATPRIEVYSYKKKKAGLYELEVQNSGSAHAILSSFDLEAVKDKNKTLIKMADQDEKLFSVNLLPGERRKVTFKFPKDIDSGALQFDFKKRM